MPKIEHYGALYIKYLRFKEKVKTLIFSEDKKALQQIRDLEDEAVRYIAAKDSLVAIEKIDLNSLAYYEAIRVTNERDSNNYFIQQYE